MVVLKLFKNLKLATTFYFEDYDFFTAYAQAQAWKNEGKVKHSYRFFFPDDKEGQYIKSRAMVDSRIKAEQQEVINKFKHLISGFSNNG